MTNTGLFTAGTKVSISRSDALVLNFDSSREIQAVLFLIDGRIEQEMSGMLGISSAARWILFWSVMVNKELS